MDETYIKVKGVWKYLYRAVDKEGKTVDFLMTAHRDMAAARWFFDKAIRENGAPGQDHGRQKRRQQGYKREEADTVKEGTTPIGWKAHKSAQKDADTKWTKKHRKNDFGYKLHASIEMVHKAGAQSHHHQCRCCRYHRV